MITLLSGDDIDESFICEVFTRVLKATLEIYRKNGYNNIEPMGSQDDMEKNLPKIAGSILRACKTYYDTPAEQLIQIVSSITINHYLENGNKRTAVSAGALYLVCCAISKNEESFKWIVENLEHLKYIADTFANIDLDLDEAKDKMIAYANENIFVTHMP